MFLYQKGFNLKKTGIIASNLRNNNFLTNLFADTEDALRRKSLMKVLNNTNHKMGKSIVRFCTVMHTEKRLDFKIRTAL